MIRPMRYLYMRFIRPYVIADTMLLRAIEQRQPPNVLYVVHLDGGMTMAIEKQHDHTVRWN